MKTNKKTIGYTVIIALLAVTSFFSMNLYFRERSAHDALDISTFPYTVGGWKGEDLAITEYEYDILETRNLILREYTNPAGEKLVLFIVYSETNRSVFHPPEVCLIGSGVTVADKQVEEIRHNGNTFFTNKLYTEKGDYRGMDLYCYKAGDLYTEKYYLQQAYFAFNQLLGRRIRGATIRVSMPVKDNEQAALDTLKNFLHESAEIIDTL